MREVLNAIFYLLSNGIKWRAMPHDLPKWQSVYTYFRAWEADGTWQRLNDELRVMVRLETGRNAQPRTYSWFGHYRRLSKDYEFLPTTSEMMIFTAMVHFMVRRLKPKNQAG